MTLKGDISLNCLVCSINQLAYTKQRIKLLLVWSEAIESKPVKLQPSCTVILPPRVSVLWITLSPPQGVHQLTYLEEYLNYSYFHFNMSQMLQYLLDTVKIIKNLGAPWLSYITPKREMHNDIFKPILSILFQKNS